jgi:NitT/TauT family transport system substrate-binding protein
MYSLIGYLPMTLADRLGYYRDENLKVEIANFQGGTKSVEALIGGSVDLVSGAYDNTLILQAKGVILTTVFTFVDHYGYVFGMPPAGAAKYRSPADLKGLKIGVTAPGSSTENLVRILLGKAGLTINDISSIGVGTGPSAVAALTSGRIDGLVTGEPDITRMTIDKAYVPLVDTRTTEDMNYAYGGLAAGAGSFTTAAFIKAHPDIVQAYVNALARAQRWLLRASLDEIAATVPKSFLGGDEALYKKALATAKHSFTEDGRTTQAKANITWQGMVRAGRFPETLKIDFAQTFDDSFVERANKTLAR